MKAWSLLAVALALAACAARPAAPARRVLVLGFDGLDPDLLERFMSAGELPSFRRFAETGSLRRLGTTIPPQSPVAWSTFITGLDPGGHGIYDFIHREPAPKGNLPILPYLSTSRVEQDEYRLTFGSYALPLRSGTVELLRRGRAFWNVLADHGIPATLVKIPANFPPEPSRARTLSDMGTPDLRGTYGTFFLFTSDPADGAERSVSGGVIHVVRPEANRVRGSIPGPENPFRRDRTRASRDFDAFLDPESGAVKIEIGDQEVLLAAGEWSGWVPVEFPFLAGLGPTGIVRFHLSQVAPHFRLYVTPVNIDPSAPVLPISTPADYAEDLFERVGYFYTQGIPELSSSLTADALDDREWLSQAGDIHAERVRLFEVEVERFRSGLLFVYFGGVDQVSHLFWRTLDSEAENDGAILDAYRDLDRVVGRVLEVAGPDWTVLILSDHGFAPYRRSVHLNSWLRDQGLLALRSGARTSGEVFADVDWSETRAYGLGLNGLYLNLEGRERFGTVAAADRERLIGDISERLLAWRDPPSGERVVSRVYRRDEVYGPARRDLAPDLVIGYRRGYRVSNESALGEVPESVIEDNRKKWSGDHCIAAEEVPGVLLANRRVIGEDLGLEDVAPTVLAEFGVAIPKEMIGEPFLR